VQDEARRSRAAGYLEGGPSPRPLPRVGPLPSGRGLPEPRRMKRNVSATPTGRKAGPHPARCRESDLSHPGEGCRNRAAGPTLPFVQMRRIP